MGTHSRSDFFNELLPGHAFYHRLYEKLDANDLTQAQKFLDDNKDLANDQYCTKVLRQEYGPELKGLKRHAIVNELLLVAGTLEQSWGKPK